MKVDDATSTPDRGARPLPDPDRDRRIGSAISVEDVLEAIEAGHARRTLSLDAPQPSRPTTESAPALETIGDARARLRPGRGRARLRTRPTSTSASGRCCGCASSTSSPSRRSASGSASRRCRSRGSAGGRCGSCSRRCAARTRAVRCRRRRAARNSRFGSRRPGRRMTTTEQARKESEMSERIEGKRVAFLVANEGVEQVELTEPWQAVEDAGGKPELIAPEGGRGPGDSTTSTRRDTFEVDRTVDDADAGDYDGLVLPGGVANPDHPADDRRPRSSSSRAFFEAGKPVGGDLPRPVDAGRGGRRRGPDADLVAEPADRHPQRRRRVGRRGGPRRRRARHEPQARRPRRVLREDRSRRSPRACTPSSARRRSVRSQDGRAAPGGFVRPASRWRAPPRPPRACRTGRRPGRSR